VKELQLGWYDRAVCKGMDGKIFFPDISAGTNHRGVFDEAIKVCGLCPVRRECLQLAMDAETNDIRRYGVFGGKTPRQRDIIGDKKK
jgi:WhiB family redox-sensing transcriptional regulator